VIEDAEGKLVHKDALSPPAKPRPPIAQDRR
jgi:hypothetical protein